MHEAFRPPNLPTRSDYGNRASPWGQTARSPRLPDTDFSIVAIIPLYNGARWIEQAVSSVLAQTRLPDEFIIVDDGSTDDGAVIVERLAEAHPLITFLRKPNGGQSSARNFGVAHSSSALLAFLDQDDIWYPHHLEVLIAPFVEGTPIPLGWTYSNVDEIDVRGQLVNREMLDLLPTQHPKQRLLECLGRDMMILPSASLISRESFERVGGFDERLSGYEDDDLFLRIFQTNYANIYIQQSLSQWRLSPESCSFQERFRKSGMIYFEKLRQAFPDDLYRNIYYARDVLAPRFVMNLLAECARSIRYRDHNRLRLCCDDLARLAGYLSLRRRVTVATFSILGRSLALAKLMVPTWRALANIIAKRAATNSQRGLSQAQPGKLSQRL